MAAALSEAIGAAAANRAMTAKVLKALTGAHLGGMALGGGALDVSVSLRTEDAAQLPEVASIAVGGA